MKWFQRFFKKEEKPIWKMATIYKSWSEFGYPKYPRDKGMTIELPMESGKTGIYKLIGSERAWGVDWHWLLWELQDYKEDK